MKLSTRQHDIISYICSCQDYVTIDNIATSVSASTRTVKRELEEIDLFFNAIGIVLERKSGMGVKIEVTDTSRQAIDDVLAKKTLSVFSQDKRVISILLELLFDNEPKKRFALASGNGVTELTISSDLVKCEASLKAKGIILVKKQGAGVYVSASEERRRVAILETIFMATKGMSIVGVSSVMLDRFIDRQEVVEISKILSKFNKEESLYRSDRARDNLALAIYIMLKRIASGNTVTLSETDDDKAVKELGERILTRVLETNKTVSLKSVTVAEKVYFASVLKSMQGLIAFKKDSSGTLAHEIAGRLSAEISSRFGIIIDYDGEFFQSLVRHLISLVHRNRKNITLLNPIIDEVKTNYKSHYDMTKECLDEITSETGMVFNDSEISYLTLHMCVLIEDGLHAKTSKCKALVVCPSGMVLSQLLSMTIKKEFREIDVVKAPSSTNIKGILKDMPEIDIVISTQNIDNINLPVIIVSSIMSSADKEKIAQALEDNKWKKYTTEVDKIEKELERYKSDKHESKDAIETIVNELFVEDNASVETAEKLIQLVANRVTRTKECANEVIVDLTRREEIGSTIMSDGEMMLLHARTDGVLEPKLGIVKTKKPIKIGSEKDSKVSVVLVMLSPKQSTNNVIKVFNVISQALVESDKFYNDIKKENEDNAKESIKKILYNYYYNNYKN